MQELQSGVPEIVDDILKVHDTTRVHISIFLSSCIFFYEMLTHPRVTLQLPCALVYI